MKIVIKVGGSVSIGPTGPNFSYFSRLLPVLRRVKEKNQLIVAIGGGKLTREYYKSIEKFEISDSDKEKIFLELIKANVRFLSTLLKMKPLFDLDKISKNTRGVIGGIKPGRSTDANAAIAARKIKADLFIKLTNVDGVHDKDPNKFKKTRKIDKMNFSDLRKITKKGGPNNYGILDATAIRVLSGSKTKTVIIDGKDPENILRVLSGKKIGTIISE